MLSMRRALRKHWAEGFHLSLPIEIATKSEHEMLRDSESFSECPLFRWKVKIIHRIAPPCPELDQAMRGFVGPKDIFRNPEALGEG